MINVKRMHQFLMKGNICEHKHNYHKKSTIEKSKKVEIIFTEK